MKSKVGTISDKTRLNGTAFEIHDPVNQRPELFTLLRSDTDDIPPFDADHTTLGRVRGGHEVVENGVDLVTLANPSVCEIGEQDGLWSRLLRQQRRKALVLNSRLGLVFEVGSFRSLRTRDRSGQDMGTDELRDSIDENLSGCCTEGEWVTVPKDNVWRRCYYEATRTEVSFYSPASYPRPLLQFMMEDYSHKWLTRLDETNPMIQSKRLRGRGYNGR